MTQRVVQVYTFALRKQSLLTSARLRKPARRIDHHMLANNWEASQESFNILQGKDAVVRHLSQRNTVLRILLLLKRIYQKKKKKKIGSF